MGYQQVAKTVPNLPLIFSRLIITENGLCSLNQSGSSSMDKLHNGIHDAHGTDGHIPTKTLEGSIKGNGYHIFRQLHQGRTGPQEDAGQQQIPAKNNIL